MSYPAPIPPVVWCCFCMCYGWDIDEEPCYGLIDPVEEEPDGGFMHACEGHDTDYGPYVPPYVGPIPDEIGSWQIDRGES